MSSHRTRLSWCVVLAGLGLAVCGVGHVEAQPDDGPPSVVGEPVEVAESRLRAWDSDLVIERVNSVPLQVDPDEVVVVEQKFESPEPYSEEPKPKVELRLGVAMPWLTGETWADARTRLYGVGLDWSPLLESAADDDVVVLAPTAGLPIAFGTEVRLKLGPGESVSPDPPPTVPLIVGLSVEEARNSLNDRGLLIDLEVIGDEGEIGAIVSQSPDANTSVEAGSIVRATATRVASNPPGGDDSETPAAPPNERDAFSRMWLVSTAVALAVLVLGGTATAARHVRRIRARRDLEWVTGHVETVPRPDPAPRTLEQDSPDALQADIRFVGEPGPAPTYAEELSRS